MTETFPDAYRVRPAKKAITGSLAVPGSKSIGNRAILLAACANGESRLRGVLDSDDTRAALRTLAALGVPCRMDGDNVVVSGNGLDFPVRNGDIDIGSSGTVGRFLPGLLAAAAQGKWRLVSTPQLAARPLKPLVDGLRQWHARLEQPEAGASFPLLVSAEGLVGGEAVVSAKASSQFASGLLMAAPLCRKPAAVVIRDLDPEECYIDMTLDLLRQFGVAATSERENGITTVSFAAPQSFAAADLAIEADANTANYFLALAALTGGAVSIDNLHFSSGQPGVKFLDVFQRLGCTVNRNACVSITGPALPLHGGFAIDMRAMSEMALTLGVMAVFADKPVAMTNLAHIRGHESDRIAALASLLGQVGATVEETADSITIHPLPVADIKNTEVDPLDDHRIAMSFSVLGAAANGVTILNPQCVAKTCPGFFSSLARMGVDVLR